MLFLAHEVSILHNQIHWEEGQKKDSSKKRTRGRTDHQLHCKGVPKLMKKGENLYVLLTPGIF